MFTCSSLPGHSFEGEKPPDAASVEGMGTKDTLGGASGQAESLPIFTANVCSSKGRAVPSRRPITLSIGVADALARGRPGCQPLA